MKTVKIGEVAKAEQRNPVGELDVAWLLNLDAIEKDTGRVIDRVEMPRESMGASTIYFDADAVLYSKLRPNLNKVVLPTECGFATSEILPLYVDEAKCLREYLALFLRSKVFVSWASEKTAGAKMPRIKRADLMSALLPLPPIEGQANITSKLLYIQELQLIAGKYLIKLDELVKSRFVEMFGDPIENPFGWDIASLGELGDLKNGVNFKSVDSGTEIRCLGVGDFKNRHQIRDMGLISLVSLNGKPNDSQLLRDGDIVFVRSNGNKQLVGRCLAVFPGNEEVTFSGFCIRFRNESDKLLLDYLLGCLKSDSMRKAMTGRGANIQNLSQKILASVNMPMPPLSLQQEFAAFVQQVDKLRFDVQQSIDKLQMLYDSLAQEYFSVDEVRS